MTNACVLAALAGLTMPSLGGIGTDLVVSLTFDRTSIGIGETAVATMTASWGVTGLYFSSVNVDMIASGAFVAVGDIAPVAWNNPVLGFDGQGVALGADIISLQAGQFSLIPPFTTDNPILITTFVVSGIAEGALSYHTVNAAGAPYPYSLTKLFIGGPGNPPFGNEVFVSQTLVVTPGPSTAALVIVAGVGGFGRRRR